MAGTILDSHIVSKNDEGMYTVYYSCRDWSLTLLPEAVLCENFSLTDITSRLYESMILIEHVSHGHRSRCDLWKNLRRTQSTKCSRQDASHIHNGQWQSSWYDTEVVISAGFMGMCVCFYLFLVMALSDTAFVCIYFNKTYHIRRAWFG